ncbi:hypothetical protein HK405_005401 [Cladochytrium tenue]|nr:hypothetical protein HK405_005401 [Cladochytrium tenue]
MSKKSSASRKVLASAAGALFSGVVSTAVGGFNPFPTDRLADAIVQHSISSAAGTAVRMAIESAGDSTKKPGIPTSSSSSASAASKVPKSTDDAPQALDTLTHKSTPSGPAGGVGRDLIADYDHVASASAAPADGGESFGRSLSPSSSADASTMLGGGGGGVAPDSGSFELQPSFACSTSASDASAGGYAEESRTYAYYFKITDLEGKGAVSTNAAVAFMSRSQLDRNVLSQVADS